MSKRDIFENGQYREGTTDGLPVISPTAEHVSAMLEATDLPGDHEIGRLGTRKGILTIEKLAVNGVMAGCLPVHMPILEAGAEAMCDPESNLLQSSVSTDSYGMMWLVNGPIRDELDINSGTGAWGSHFWSNQSIPRALALTYKNTARLHPGEKNMGTQGNPFRFHLLAGENEEESPWDGFHVEQGRRPDDSAITFANPTSYLMHGSNSGAETNPRGVLNNIIQNIPMSMKCTRAPRLIDKLNTVYIALCPANAEELSDYSKQEIKEFIYNNAYHRVPGALGEDLTEDGGCYTPAKISPDQREALKDIAPIHQRLFDTPESIKIIVTGGSGRRNALIGRCSGGPVTKTITLPENWADVVDNYRPLLDRDWGPET